MKKDGFVLVESVVVLVIVVLALTLFLSSYFLLTRKSESKDYYDLPNDKYLLYNVANIWSLGNNGGNAYTETGSFVIDKNTCSTKVAKYSNDECKKIFNDTSLERYAVIYNLNYMFDTGRIKDIPGITSDIIEYLKTLKKLDGSTDLSYVIGVFKRTDAGKSKKYYAALTFNPYPTTNNPDDNNILPSGGEYILTSVGTDIMPGQSLTTTGTGTTYGGNTLSVTASTGGVRLPRVFKYKNKYLVTYKIRKNSGTLYSIGGKVTHIKNMEFYIDGIAATSSYYSTKSVTNIADDTNIHTIKVIYTASGSSDSTIDFYIQPNYQRSDAVSIDITDLHIYQIYSGPSIVTYNDVYSVDNLPFVSNDLSNVNNMKNYIHLGWYKEESFTNKISAGDNFTSSTATFINDKDALVFAKIMKESEVPTYCTLTATSSKVKFDKIKGESFQINTSSSTPATYDNQSSVSIAVGTYYGHTKSGSDTYTCSISITQRVADGYSCLKTGCSRATIYCGQCSCSFSGDGPGPGYTYTPQCGNYSNCEDACSAVGHGNSYLNKWSGRCGYSTTHVSTSSCPTGYSDPQQEYKCQDGYTRVDSTNFCMK